MKKAVKKSFQMQKDVIENWCEIVFFKYNFKKY